MAIKCAKLTSRQKQKMIDLIIFQTDNIIFDNFINQQISHKLYQKDSHNQLHRQHRRC